MTHERLAVTLAQRFGLRPRLLVCTVAFQWAITEALRVVSEEELLGWVLEGGGFAGVRNPYGALIARIRRIPENASAESRMLGEAAESRRWRQVEAAACRGETLRALVERGDVFGDEAVERIEAEFPDEELRALAMAGLRGGDA
jgi:hypothetical protein